MDFLIHTLICVSIKSCFELDDIKRLIPLKETSAWPVSFNLILFAMVFIVFQVGPDD